MATKTFAVVDASGCSMCEQYMVDDLQMPTFMKPPDEAAAIVRNVPNIKVRDDDVMLATFPKSGTNWGYEILSMLLNRKAEISPNMKVCLMLEARTEAELDEQPSPRVLNSHLPLAMLPRQMKEKKTKIIWIARNPKDAIVSLYYHITGMKMFQYNGKFADFLTLFLENKLPYQSWFEYTLDLEKAMLAEPDKIHFVYFEDIKENGVAEIKRLATFLGVDADDELVSAINEKCSFKSLAAEKVDMPRDSVKNNFSFFRKGIIGDWKNHFTVAESENFDRIYKEKMKASSLKLRFEPAKIEDKK